MIRCTDNFMEATRIAEKLRKEDGLSHTSEMEMMTAIYMMQPNSLLVQMAQELGVPVEIVEEILVEYNDKCELSEEEIKGGLQINYSSTNPDNGEVVNETFYFSKTLKEVWVNAAEINNGLVTLEKFFVLLVKKGRYCQEFYISLLGYRKKSEDDVKAESDLKKSLEALNNSLQRLQEAQKKLNQIKNNLPQNNQQELPNKEEHNQQEQTKESEQPLVPAPTSQVVPQREEHKTLPRPKKDETAIPKRLADCMTLMNDKICKGEKCEILGRDMETKELEKILLKVTKRNAVLIGDAGVGKTAIVEKLVWDIVNEECPEQLKGLRVISLTLNGIVARTKYRGQAEEKFQILTEFLEKNPDVILFIDEIHNMLGAGACKEGDIDLANVLKPALSRGVIRVIGATTSYEYKKYFSKDPALKRRFEKVDVKEPKTFEVYDMIKNKIEKLEMQHEVLISKELVDFCIYTASCYKPDVKNPDRTLDLIDTSMALANLKGEHMLTQEIILENFERSMKKLDETPIVIKRATSYHESGHYVLGKFSQSLEAQKVIAVTIIPYEGEYMGANVYEPVNSFNTFMNKDFFIQQIASLQAGRLAEKENTGFITAGAQADVKQATKLAKDYVTKYAMSESISTTRSYAKEDENDITYMTEETNRNISEQIDKILKEAEEYAKKVLLEHSAELKALSEALLEKSILSDDEITKIFADLETSSVS